MTIANVTPEAAIGLQPEFVRAGVEVPGWATGGRAPGRAAALSPNVGPATGAAANGWRGALTRAFVDDPSSRVSRTYSGQEGPARSTGGSTSAANRPWLRQALSFPPANPPSERPSRSACEQKSIRDGKAHTRDMERHGMGGPKHKREAAISALNSGSGMTWPSANGTPAAVVVPVSGEATQRPVTDSLERSGQGNVMDPPTSSMHSMRQGMLAPADSVPNLQRGGHLPVQTDSVEVLGAQGEISQFAGSAAAKPGSAVKSIDFSPARRVGGPAGGPMINTGSPSGENAPVLPLPGQRAPGPYPTPLGGSTSSSLASGAPIAMGQEAQAAHRKMTDAAAPLPTTERSQSHPSTKEATTARTLRNAQGSGPSSAPTNWRVVQHATAGGKDPTVPVPAAPPAAPVVNAAMTSLAGKQDNPGRGSVTEQAFTALDTANSKTGFTWSHLSARQAEAGYQDPVLGWVNVRAQSDSSGIHAALVPSSAAAAQSLRGHLDGLQAFLHNQQTSVLTVQVSKPEAFAMGQGSGHGQGQNAGQGPPQNSPEGGGTGTGQGAETGGRGASVITRGAESLPGSHRGIDSTAARAVSEVRVLGGNHVSVIA